MTVKVRSGTVRRGPFRLEEFCLTLEKEGADGVILHPRTGSERLKRPPRWEEIGMVKEVLRIPVMGNGDVFGPEDALRMF